MDGSLSKTKRSNLRLSFADAAKTTTTESSKLTNNVSTSETTTKCHRKYYTESKVQTKPNIGRKNSSAQASTTPPKARTRVNGRKNSSAQASTTPPKARTRVKSFQSARTATPGLIATYNKYMYSVA